MRSPTRDSVNEHKCNAEATLSQGQWRVVRLEYSGGFIASLNFIVKHDDFPHYSLFFYRVTGLGSQYPFQDWATPPHYSLFFYRVTGPGWHYTL